MTQNSNKVNFLVLIALQKRYFLSIDKEAQIYSHNENSNKTFELLGLREFLTLFLVLLVRLKLCLILRN